MHGRPDLLPAAACHRYSLPCGQPDDIKRYQQRGKCNKIASYSSPSQALLAASSINACPSTLAICAGTNRCGFSVLGMLLLSVKLPCTPVPVIFPRHPAPQPWPLPCSSISPVCILHGTHIHTRTSPQPTTHRITPATTHRSLELVDLATMACVATINDAHDRPVHSIAQLGPSPYTSHNREAHELFATAAQDGTIKVWDVRSAAAVRVLTGHKSAQLTRLGMAFSPCLRCAAM